MPLWHSARKQGGLILQHFQAHAGSVVSKLCIIQQVIVWLRFQAMSRRYYSTVLSDNEPFSFMGKQNVKSMGTSNASCQNNHVNVTQRLPTSTPMVFIIVQSSPLQTDGNNHVSWVGNTWNFRRATKYRILRMTRIADLCASVSLSIHRCTPVIYTRWHINTAHTWNHANIHCIQVQGSTTAWDRDLTGFVGDSKCSTSTSTAPASLDIWLPWRQNGDVSCAASVTHIHNNLINFFLWKCSTINKFILQKLRQYNDNRNLPCNDTNEFNESELLNLPWHS